MADLIRSLQAPRCLLGRAVAVVLLAVPYLAAVLNLALLADQTAASGHPKPIGRRLLNVIRLLVLPQAEAGVRSSSIPVLRLHQTRSMVLVGMARDRETKARGKMCTLLLLPHPTRPQALVCTRIGWLKSVGDRTRRLPTGLSRTQLGRDSILPRPRIDLRQ